MSSRIEDIRKIMDLVDGEPNALRSGPQMLSEGILDGLKAYMHKREGRLHREEVVTNLFRAYHVWLGKMDRKGTMRDIEDFLRSADFDSSEIDNILGPVSAQEPADSEDEPEHAEAGSADEVEPEQQEPEAEDEPAADTPEHDPEEGRPVPADLDTKMSDYGEVGKNEFHAEASTYKNEDGSWNEDLILQKLEKLAQDHDGAPVLVLGDSKFSLQDHPGEDHDEVEQEPVAAESITEDADVRVGKRQLKDIFNRAAVEFIKKNGGRTATASRATDSTAHAGSATGNSRAKNGDPYDLDIMWQILQKMGMSKNQVTRIMTKVRSSGSVASLSDNDLQDLGLIGFAFLKSGL